MSIVGARHWPPSASERLMYEPSLVSITQSLIGQARAEEAVRRLESAAKDARIGAEQAAQADTRFAAAVAQADPIAGRKLKRALALGDGPADRGNKRGRVQ